MSRAWMDDAACVEVDPDMFFPEDNNMTRAPASVCATCPVAQQCLDYAVRNGIVDGVWGGVAGSRRASMRAGMCRECNGPRPKGHHFCGPCRKNRVRQQDRESKLRRQQRQVSA